MSRNVIETVMGAVVLVIAGSFLITAYEGRSMKTVNNGYRVRANFENATGVSVGSDVRMGGVKIGIVDAMELDTTRYQAQVEMTIRDTIPIPTDSTAAIVGDGLLGGKFVSIEPGAEEAMIKDGGTLEYTQSSVSLEEMIGKFVFSGGGVEGGGKEEKKEEGTADSPPLGGGLFDEAPVTPETPAPQEASPAPDNAPEEAPEEIDELDPVF